MAIALSLVLPLSPSIGPFLRVKIATIECVTHTHIAAGICSESLNFLRMFVFFGEMREWNVFAKESKKHTPKIHYNDCMNVRPMP